MLLETEADRRNPAKRGMQCPLIVGGMECACPRGIT